MQKRLAILTVFLFVASAGFPSPGETANPKTDSSTSKAQTSQSQQPSTVGAAARPEPSNSQTFNNNANEKTEKDGWDKAAVLSNYLLVVIGIGGICAALFTFQAIKDQVIEMRNTGIQTDSLIRENIAQSASLERSVAETARSAAAMEGVSKSLESTVKVSSETLQGLRKQMRAYLTVVVGGGIPQNRESNLKFDARPLLVNAGPTPARNVLYRIKAAILPIPLPRDFDDTVWTEKEEGGNMMGAHQNAQMMGVVEDYVPEDQIEDIKTGNGVGMYAWGIVTYEDVFGDNHTTKFCQRLTWLNDGNVFGYYIPGRNDAD
jgi:hypothetical protein